MTVADFTKMFEKHTHFQFIENNFTKSTTGIYYFEDIPLYLLDKIVCEARVNTYCIVQVIVEA